MSNKKIFPKLFEPIKIGEMSLRNRLVMLPLGGYFCGVNSDVTERSIAYFRERAKGGIGLITVGLTGVTPINEPITQKYFSLGEDRLLKGHYYLTEAVHIHGAKISIQLCHVGAQMTTADYGGKQPLSPSGIQQFTVSGQPFGLPRPMTRSEIYYLIDQFIIAAMNARKAGYDAVEIHCAHGYLLSAFLSPATNRRNDEFGGNLANRTRIAVEIIKGIRQTLGDNFPIIVRMNADDFVEGGITTRESPKVALLLQNAGANVLSVSCGMYVSHDKMNDTMNLTEGWKLPLWQKIKQTVDIPIIAGGGNRTPEFCEKVLEEGIADFIGLGRPLYSDPYWSNKVLENRIEDINKCISCLRCMLAPGGYFQDVRHCTVNAMWGREIEYINYSPVSKKKRVIVVGGGVAGMEAARVASSRGHEVILYEKGNELGGQLLVASVPTNLGKYRLLWIRDYLVKQMEKQGVKIILGKEVTADMVDELKPDALVIATGATPLIPNIPNIQSDKVVTAWDVFSGKHKFEGKVTTVLGGNLVGCEVAEFLAERGNNITILKRRPTLAEDMEPINRQVLINKLHELEVRIVTGRRVTEITDYGVGTTDLTGKNAKVFPAEKIVLAMGSVSNKKLIDELRGQIPELYEIGDCVKPRTILEAIADGFLIGYHL